MVTNVLSRFLWFTVFTLQYYKCIIKANTDLINSQSKVIWNDFPVLKPDRHVSNNIFVVQLVIFIEIFFKSFLVYHNINSLLVRFTKPTVVRIL